MHRHGYKGRKFGRERDQRVALIRSLAVSLIEHGSIETTLPKAKELRPTVEKLISKAKKSDLHSRRQIVSTLNSVTAAHKLVDQIAPAMNRSSGYLRITKTSARRGDNTQMAKISFVDSIEDTSDSTKQKSDRTVNTEHDVKKPTNPVAKAAKTGAKADTQAKSAAKAAPATTKRTGVRGNR